MHYATEAANPPSGATVRYAIESRGSTFTAKAFATGVLSMFGHSPTISIPDFEGDVSLNTEAIEQSSMRLVIHPASLTVIDDISKKDRDEINRAMHQEVIESDSFPEIIYECSGVTASKSGDNQYLASLNGELTLHGVTRNQPVSARISLGGDLLRAAGDLTVRLSDYDIRPVKAAGGAVKLKDELKLMFDISARKRA